MKRKVTLFLGIIFVITFVILVILEFVLNQMSKTQEILFKIFEILTMSGSTFMLSFSILVKINKDNNLKVKNGSVVDNARFTKQTGEGNTIIDNSIHNDPKAMIEAFKECIVPMLFNNVENIAKKNGSSAR